ncbi:hypothetical protein GCM10023321_31960 [Pseudonocardia eucalypti]|uniref:UspA domain-containing protein n=1 Tax=Pseudonocardia eucalypti TaxID=648755 RepID=A0ABP9QAF9_9PSEU|nr:nucleotide-binding universal stress UspA family protein [Pseudonocardia eucalypti]
MSAPGRGSFVVVGVDGSDASLDALRWAARQAELTGAALHAVTVWQWPTTYGYAPGYSDVDFAALAEETLTQAVEQTFGTTPGVVVVRRVLEGHPASALTEAARGADLLVVGSRGHGGFAGMLLGSVGQHCVQHAPCPVVITRHIPAAREVTGARASSRRSGRPGS